MELLWRSRRARDTPKVYGWRNEGPFTSLSLQEDGIVSPGCQRSTLQKQLRKPVLVRKITQEKLRLNKGAGKRLR